MSYVKKNYIRHNSNYIRPFFARLQHTEKQLLTRIVSTTYKHLCFKRLTFYAVLLEIWCASRDVGVNTALGVLQIAEVLHTFAKTKRTIIWLEILHWHF